MKYEINKNNINIFLQMTPISRSTAKTIAIF